jgi:hypothetical protein
MHRPTIVATAALASLLLVAPPARGDDGWTWPVRGRVVTMYSNDNARPYARGMHRGIDIAADRGAAVVAARAGTVTYAGPLGAAGTIVAVRAGRYATSYLHLGSVWVSRGDRVALGARLGEVGTTGRRSVTEPHLHFGVRLAGVDNRYLDPLSLLPAIGGRRERLVPVPAGPVPRAEPKPVRHPVATQVKARAHVAVPERGQPLVWGGVLVLALALFGGVQVTLVRRRAPRAACRASLARPR